MKANQQTYVFNVLDRCEFRTYKAEIKATNLNEAQENCIDFYCYALDCDSEALSLDLVEIK